MPKDKQPPRNLWDKPWRLAQFLDEVWDKDTSSKKEEIITFDEDELE